MRGRGEGTLNETGNPGVSKRVYQRKMINEKKKKQVRRNGGLYGSHTLTLGQALMLAGLSVEGRFLCHACGPRRALLKNYYPALSLRSYHSTCSVVD